MASRLCMFFFFLCWYCPCSRPEAPVQVAPCAQQRRPLAQVPMWLIPPSWRQRLALSIAASSSPVQYWKEAETEVHPVGHKNIYWHNHFVSSKFLIFRWKKKRRQLWLHFQHSSCQVPGGFQASADTHSLTLVLQSSQHRQHNIVRKLSSFPPLYYFLPPLYVSTCKLAYIYSHMQNNLNCIRSSCF